jgi:BirA family biotin operon repressor/biotin-[acetyl-CoA-carboxylase] ligase
MHVTGSIFPTRYLKEVDSTNSYALRNLDVLRDREVIIADIQTGGHGRFSRKWLSNVPDNLYMSIVLKPSGKTDTLTGLTLYMSTVICELLEEYGVKSSLKWPNDVLVQGEKIAGILGETKYQKNTLKGYVLGTGINLNMTVEECAKIDQPATSLNLHTGKRVNRDDFTDRLLKGFFSSYRNYLSTGFSLVRDAYLQRCAIIGRKIIISTQDQQYSTTAKSLTADGEMIIEKDDGKEMIVRAGEIISILSL